MKCLAVLLAGIALGGCSSNKIALGSVRKALILDDAALKTASDAHLQPVNSASSAVFALPDPRLKLFIQSLVTW